ncbi:carboxypeptidase regulatory-like domain-containing protein [Bryobacter aggregatus]|uniref:carboxypeptidase regulatory-like domain-containing protein n=1 Tax=Bryobacter aggregatus TaxID=360054 RepID=UPI00068B582C|nr:carboxypeptidase regulatory-like domain-containing protein [Bryobacter aggregatus]
MRFFLCLWCLGLVCLAEQKGQVRFSGLPVPGVTITATRGQAQFSTVTDLSGNYSFPTLAEGEWKLELTMLGFAKLERSLSSNESQSWDLQVLKLEEMKAQAAAPPPKPAEIISEVAKPEPKPSAAFANLDAAELAQRAADALLINGTANNGAASPFSQSMAFGNNRRGPQSLYSGSLGMIFDHSVLDARPYSLTGQDTPRPDFSRMQGLASFGGPLRIPRLLPRNGPNLTLTYQWTRNKNVSTQSSLVPTLDQRNGIFTTPVLDPTTGLPFINNTVPMNRISPQAKALLQLYPLPNFDNTGRYNFQTALVGATHQDNLQARGTQSINRKNQLAGNAAWQSTRSDSTSLFGFNDTTSISGLNLGLNWIHTFRPRLYSVVGVQYSSLRTENTPFFSNRTNVSGAAGILGNNQDPVNWGPPALTFAGGIAALSDGIYALNRNRTSGLSGELGWSRGRHNLAFGGSFRQQQFNILSQEDPRGSFAFTGASDFAGFLLGVPATSAIAFGNADKYLRSKLFDAFVRDDFRVNPGLTLNLGLRWDYSTPISEIYGRLVNLQLSPDFRSATPTLGNGLLRPDRKNISPRLGLAWRPFAASSTVIRAGYGIYYDTSVYQLIATQMAQQSPLSYSLRVANSAETPLTLRSGFLASAATTRNTFAVDPNFRIGSAQNWFLTVQRDLPGSLVMIASYLGSKGSHAQQQVLPNTAPDGATDPCPTCPAGFAYLSSNGGSNRNAAQLELRRRLRAGFTATMQYTYSKSIDNAALGGRNQGGSLIAQNWLDLGAERAKSNFDQRHLFNLTGQYTSGMGKSGLMSGWRGRLLKEWTLGQQLIVGSGLPLTPVYFRAVQGTGVTGSIRPDYTGADVSAAPSGLFLNPAAYVAPAPGRWGNAGRNSITGPSQFSWNASLGRTFRLRGDRISLDGRMDATNLLNHPVFPSWNTITTSSQFGLPNPANPMRSIQTTMRLRF